MDKKTVLCKDCRHYQHITTLQECTRKVVHSPIDGSQTWPLASDERSPMFGTCGPDGLHYSSLSSLSQSIAANRYWPEYRSLLKATMNREVLDNSYSGDYTLNPANDWLMDAIQHVFSKCSIDVQKALIEEEKKNG